MKILLYAIRTILVFVIVPILYAVDPVGGVWREYLQVDFEIKSTYLVNHFEVIDSDSGKPINEISFLDVSQTIYLDFYMSIDANSNFSGRVDLVASNGDHGNVPFVILSPNPKGDLRSLDFKIEPGKTLVNKNNVKRAFNGMFYRVPLIINPQNLKLSDGVISITDIPLMFQLNIDPMGDL
jgi:hypothetical protein